MSIDQIILLVTGVAACLSAIAALLTVRKLSKQIAESYRPELIIARTNFKSQEVAEKALSFNWIIPNADNARSPYASKSFFVPLWNVGFGSAKKVKIYWNFPIDKLVSLVNRLAQKSLTSVHFEWSNEWLSVESDESSPILKKAENWTAQKESAIDFILPASTDQTATELIEGCA